jgi:group I intron endonuclease
MHIYTIKNLINGKMYVGQTVQSNAKMRWYAHCDMMRKGKKSYLYDSMRKYGVENFLWEVVDQANTIDQLNNLETAWATKLRTQGITLYNNRETGNNKKHSPESIEKMRQVHKLRHATTVVSGWKRQDGGAMKGKTHKAETKQKMSISHTGSTRGPLSNNHKEKISLGIKKILAERGNEYRNKISQSVKANWAKRKGVV